MRLLVSVCDAREATAALDGGADLVDAKNPRVGALGAVSLATLAAIRRTVGGARPVTAAIGDAADDVAVERDAAAFTAAGAALIKIGFADVTSRERLASLIAAAARGASPDRVIAVAYADYARTGGPPPADVIAAAARAKLAGVLIDTADKRGPGLTSLMPPAVIAETVAAARAAGLLCALAGKLTADDVGDLRGVGADIVGVRGAACDGGRLGAITAARVRALRQRCRLRVARALPAPAPLAPRRASDATAGRARSSDRPAVPSRRPV